MVAIREGMNGAVVRRAQSLLNASRGARRPLVADGRFGRLTREAVMAFQQSNGLTADGIIGAETWRALEAQPLASVVDKYAVGPQEMLADVAALYVGTTETLDNRMGNDARLREIFEADDLVNKDGTTDGYAWCCAFVSVCIQRLFAMSPMFPTVSAPRVASVHLFRTRWAPEQGCLIFPPSAPHAPHKGDVVVFTFSHIGIVESTGPGAIQTIEGNTNEQGSREGTTCRRKQRALAQIRCFIRMPVVGNIC
jgi:hypothetical protein